MLDDLKMIHERDAQDALGIAEKQWQQLEYDFELGELSFPIEHVVYAGMGGSALAALLSQTWPGYAVPFEVVRNYNLPAYVSDKTLCIISSYSGNTEESLSAAAEAATKTPHIVIITSGGKLADLGRDKGYPLLLLPTGYQPRHAVLYNLKALVTILERSGLAAGEQVEAELHQAGQFLKQALEKWLPTVSTKDNYAKQLALECVGKSVVVYAGPKLAPAAYKWKISFNENAKQVAWWNQFPEFNHNEFLGWTEQPVNKPYVVIELQSRLEHERVQKRFSVTNRLLSGQMPAPEIVEAQGETLVEQLLWMVALGDFVSLYTALLNGLNPTPVELIEKFKHELNN